MNCTNTTVNCNTACNTLTISTAKTPTPDACDTSGALTISVTGRIHTRGDTYSALTITTTNLDEVSSACNDLGLPFVLYMMVKASGDQLQRLARSRVQAQW